MMEYVVILEEGETSFGAYVPDLPGCVAVGETREEAMELIREAIEFHVESLRENGEPVPPPHSFVETVAVIATLPEDDPQIQ
jgi:predicted RNase H-like HicB family nuclease